MPSLSYLINKVSLTRTINTRVPNELVNLEVKIKELHTTHKIKQSSKKELFSLMHKNSVLPPIFRFTIEVNTVVYLLSGTIAKGNNFDRVIMKLQVNRPLAVFYWFAFIFMCICTGLLVQQAAHPLILTFNAFLLLKIVLFFVSCNQELDKIQNRTTGFLVKTNRQTSMYTGQQA